MKGTRLRSAVWIALAISAGTTSAQAQDGPVVVNKSDFDCLMGRLSQVPSEPRGVFIDIADCPRRGVRVIRHLIAPPPNPPGAAATKLYITPSRLECLRRNRNNLKKIARSLESGRYSVTMAPCPR